METCHGIAGLLEPRLVAAVGDDWREVLVVDDDRAMLQLLSAILVGAGYEVALANDGEQAIECIEASPPDFLITDWKMPRVDGIELCRRVRRLELPKYLYTILITARTEMRHMVEAISAGADDFLPKPIRAGELLCRMQAGTRILDRERRLAWLTHHDPLTGILARRSFFAELDRQWVRSVKEGWPLACVMMDVDFFKRINDEYGHVAGDEALKAVAGLLSDSSCKRCRVGRYGGEEFCVSLADAAEQDALAWAEQRRARIASASVVVNSSVVRLTASFGVAERTGDTATPAQMLDRADQALGAAKRLGRNRVVRYSADERIACAERAAPAGGQR